MIICSHSNIDIIQGVIGYGDAEGITDWRITNTITNTNAGILNILNSTSTNVRVSILENGNVGIGTTNPASMLDIVGGDTNITGVYKKNNRDVINDTSNYVLSTSNVLVPRILSEVGNGSNYISRLISPINTRIDDTSNYMLSTSNILVNRVGNSQWTNMSSGIYYVFPNITSSPLATTGITGNYTYMVFTYTTEIDRSGTGQSLYTINVPATGVVCDILLVGGGGGGSGTVGGGGGAGALIFARNAVLNGTYTIKVGKGGTPGASERTPVLIATKGVSSSISKDTINITAEGGGASGRADGNQNGGSGGGGDYYAGNETAGTSTSYTSTAFGASIVKYGNNGANAYNIVPYNGGGGGGAGSSALKATSTNFFSNGGSGLHQVVIDGITINFATIFGTNTAQVGGVLSNGNLYYGGGGGAGGQEQATGGTGGLGGGGNGGPGVVVGGANIPNNGSNGFPNTGGGGGGGSNHNSSGGNGGSGIVIIRFLSSAANVGANVGIGTANPISKLHIYDDETNITKLTIQNNSIPTKSTPLPTQITVAGATSTTIGTSDICTSFPYSGSGTTFTYTFAPTEELICDILLIGGGGGGSAGGGGAGGYVYITNVSLLSGTTYTAVVGNGGTGGTSTTNGNQGNNSTFSGGTISYIAYGGGGGGGNSQVAPAHTTGQVGSYGGNGHDTTTVQTYTSTQGNRGGSGAITSGGSCSGGGGGGAGTIGGNSVIVSGLFVDSINGNSYTKGGQGGDGIPNTITGTFLYYAGGGTAGANTNLNTDSGVQEIPKGGGGIGSRAPGANGGNGTAGLGGGGGGGDWERTAGTNGGSGIIIIRYRRAQQGSLIELKNTPSTLALPNLITVSDAISTTLGTTERCILFPYSGTAATTTYTFTTTEPLIHDILLIGGGGGGGVGGGGGGGYLYITNIYMPAGTYTVTVGKGGSGTGTTGANGTQGSNSSFSGGTISYIAYGGGGGAGAYLAPAHTLGQVGSYGGNGVDSIVAQTYTSVQGNRGGLSGTTAYGSGGGGGGADAVGGNAVLVSGINPDAGRSYPYYRGGKGGDGKPNSITGMIVYYAGGGNGGANTNFDTDTSTQTAPLGGGGLGARAPNQGGSNGTNGLGGGGGGRDYESTFGGGDGGSGVVIIRYRKTIPNIDYKIGNFNDEFKIISSESSIDTDYIRITSTGASIYNPTASPQWSTVSDRRIKENIEKASYNKCYDNINKLELYRFNYIAELKNINKDLKQLGYIAQEVQDIFPKAVSTQEFHNDNLSIPDMLSIDIAQINYSLYGAVKKLIEIDNNKEARIQKMENLLNINNTSSNIIDTSSNIDISSSNITDISSSNVDISSSNITDISSSNVDISSSNIDISSSNIDISSSNIDISSSNIDISSSNIIDISSSNIDISSSNIDISSSNIDISSSNI